MNVKIFYRWLLLGVFVFLFLMTTTSGLADSTMTGLFNKPTDGDGLQQGLTDLTKWIFWIFYLLGAIFLGIGAFKLKQGDIGGFGKNVAGGATLFFVPAVINVLQKLGQTAVGS